MTVDMLSSFKKLDVVYIDSLLAVNYVTDSKTDIKCENKWYLDSYDKISWFGLIEEDYKNHIYYSKKVDSLTEIQKLGEENYDFIPNYGVYLTNAIDSSITIFFPLDEYTQRSAEEEFKELVTSMKSLNKLENIDKQVFILGKDTLEVQNSKVYNPESLLLLAENNYDWYNKEVFDLTESSNLEYGDRIIYPSEISDSLFDRITYFLGKVFTVEKVMFDSNNKISELLIGTDNLYLINYFKTPQYHYCYDNFKVPQNVIEEFSKSMPIYPLSSEVTEKDIHLNYWWKEIKKLKNYQTHFSDDYTNICSVLGVESFQTTSTLPRDYDTKIKYTRNTEFNKQIKPELKKVINNLKTFIEGIEKVDLLEYLYSNREEYEEILSHMDIMTNIFLTRQSNPMLWEQYLLSLQFDSIEEIHEFVNKVNNIMTSEISKKDLELYEFWNKKLNSLYLKVQDLTTRNFNRNLKSLNESKIDDLTNNLKLHRNAKISISYPDPSNYFSIQTKESIFSPNISISLKQP